MSLRACGRLITLAMVGTALCTLAAGCAGKDKKKPGAPLPPLCGVKPSEIAYDSVDVRLSRDRFFTIRNRGGGSLEGSVTADCPGFAILSGAGPFALAANESLHVVIRFAPLSAESLACEVDLGLDQCGPVLCSGIGRDRPLPPEPAMELLQPGTFTMGSPTDEPGRRHGEIQHEVTLTRPFYLSRYETLQVEWQEVMGWNESATKQDSLPVEGLTWFDAVSFCNRLSLRDQFTPVYTMSGVTYDRSVRHIIASEVAADGNANGYRLPSEAEWEYACRAGSLTAFSHGAIVDTACAPVDTTLDRIGWYCGNALKKTHQAGSKKFANAWGLHDMHGNVWEWCWDWWGEIEAGPATDPAGPASGISRVMRGGSWNSLALSCRSAYRGSGSASERFSSVGLRVARTAF